MNISCKLGSLTLGNGTLTITSGAAARTMVIGGTMQQATNITGGAEAMTTSTAA